MARRRRAARSERIMVWISMALMFSVWVPAVVLGLQHSILLPGVLLLISVVAGLVMSMRRVPERMEEILLGVSVLVGGVAIALLLLDGLYWQGLVAFIGVGLAIMFIPLWRVLHRMKP